MISKIIGTTFSRSLIAVFGLLILILNTRYLGAEKLGQLAIYIIIISAIVQVSEFVGGPSLVFLQTKYSIRHLLIASYGWSILVSLVSCVFLYLTAGFNNSQSWIISAIIFLQSLNHVHLHLLVGKEHIKGYNLSSLMLSLVIVCGIAYSYISLEKADVIDYLKIYFFALSLSLIISSWFVLRIPSSITTTYSLKLMLKEILNYGAIIQITNLLQFGVYRLNYLILEGFTSTANLGIYSVGNQLSEKALVPGNAISLVQYSSIANTPDKNKSIPLTFKMIILSGGITLFTILLLLVTPSQWFSFILGTEFKPISGLFMYLAPGVFALSISVIYSHYFAGLGLYRNNLISSGLGLILTIVLSYLLIPKHGMKGAALASSFVFIGQTIIQIYFFKNETKLSWRGILKGHKNAISYYFTKLFRRK